MTKLAELRSQLASLRRRRAGARRWTALSGLLVALVVALIALFVVDVMFSMPVVQRIVAFCLAGGCLVWAFRKYVSPWLGHRESELDMALLVERKQRIDTNDIVAAIQFEAPGAATWGSGQLQSAVIDYVSEFSRGWNVFEGFSRKPLVRRIAILAALLLLIAVAAMLYPDFASAFLNRLALGSKHYPTNVRIERVEINGVPNAPRAAYGQPLRFKLFVSNAGSNPLPNDGRIELRELKHDQRGRPIELQKQPAEKDAEETVYTGEMSSLLDGVEYQAFVGDGWTDPTKLDVIPLPVVELKLSATAPTYARNAPKDVEAVGSRQLSVFEGSRVDVQVNCTNKHLKDVSLKIGSEKYPLKLVADGSSKADAGELWQLPADPETPLTRVTGVVNYQLDVADEDHLVPDHPIVGSIRIKVDRKPTISADLVTKAVLPSANPVIDYQVNDDFGIAKVVLHVQVVKAEGESSEPVDMPVSNERILADKLPASGTYTLKLEPLKLVKGDQVRLRLEAWDYRGQSEGQSAESEPLLLNVTDDSGALAILNELDERGARQLDATTKKALETGGTK